MSAMSFREPNQVLWRGCRPGHNGVQIVKQGTADNAVATIWTVAGVSVFYMTSLRVNYITVAAGKVNCYIIDTGLALYHTLLRAVTLAGGEGRPFATSFWPPFEIPVGYAIIIQTIGVGLNTVGCVSGWGE